MPIGAINDTTSKLIVVDSACTMLESICRSPALAKKLILLDLDLFLGSMVSESFYKKHLLQAKDRDRERKLVLFTAPEFAGAETVFKFSEASLVSMMFCYMQQDEPFILGDKAVIKHIKTLQAMNAIVKIVTSRSSTRIAQTAFHLASSGLTEVFTMKDVIFSGRDSSKVPVAIDLAITHGRADIAFGDDMFSNIEPFLSGLPKHVRFTGFYLKNSEPLYKSVYDVYETHLKRTYNTSEIFTTEFLLRLFRAKRAKLERDGIMWETFISSPEARQDLGHRATPQPRL